MDKRSGSGIFPDPDPDPDLGDPKRPDPTGSGSGSATLVYTIMYSIHCNTIHREMRERSNVFRDICQFLIVNLRSKKERNSL